MNQRLIHLFCRVLIKYGCLFDCSIVHDKFEELGFDVINVVNQL